MPRVPPYDWARGRFVDEPTSPDTPNMSKMPNLKPMASHEVGGTTAQMNRPLMKLRSPDVGPSSARMKSKRLLSNTRKVSR